MFVYLLLLFTIVPIVEIALLIKISNVIEIGPTIALVILTGVVGAALAKYEGLRTLKRIQDEMGAGRLPGDSMIDGLLILVAGIVLVTPGVITDCVGLLLLIPPCRAVVRNALKKRFKASVKFTHMGGMDMGGAPPSHAGHDDDLIDVEARPVDKE